MTVVAVLTAKHAPGATTAALALAAAASDDGPAVVVEADPDGGDLAPRLGVPTVPGLFTLAAAARHDPLRLDVVEHAQPLPAGGHVVVAPPSPWHTAAALQTVAPRIVHDLRAVGGIGIVDCGRWNPASPAAPIAEQADLRLVVVTPTAHGVEHVIARTVDHRVGVERLAVVLVGDRPYGPREVHDVVGLPIAGVLPVDPYGAAALTSPAGHRSAQRSNLVRAARTLLAGLDLPHPSALAGSGRP